jgi:uncharacterized protein
MLDIHTEFELDCPKAQAWAFMTDARLSVPCFPGAELGALRDDGFYDGSFGVKLGPMSLKFGGRFKVEPVDQAAGLLKVQAQGQDNKGRGSAKSDVSCTLSEAGLKTLVRVDSKVELTGSIAQFGRAAGMIEVISKQLLLRFAANVKEALAESVPEVTVAVGPELTPAAAPVRITNANSPGSFWRWLRALFAR